MKRQSETSSKCTISEEYRNLSPQETQALGTMDA